jgi:hypothetical protein
MPARWPLSAQAEGKYDRELFEEVKWLRRRNTSNDLDVFTRYIQMCKRCDLGACPIALAVIDHLPLLEPVLKSPPPREARDETP